MSKETETKADEAQAEETEAPAEVTPTEAEEAHERPAVEEEEEKEEKIEIVEERLYTVPFRKVWITPRGKRTPRAVRTLRSFIERHMKTDDVKISNEINEALWARSIKKPPRKIRVRAVKDKEGRVIVYPAKAA